MTYDDLVNIMQKRYPPLVGTGPYSHNIGIYNSNGITYLELSPPKTHIPWYEWNAPRGFAVDEQLPNSRLQTMKKILGKGGKVTDQSTVALLDLLLKLLGLR